MSPRFERSSGRATDATSVAWSEIPAWSLGELYRTADVSALVQAVVDRPGWVAGSAIVFLITAGPGVRTALSFDGAAEGGDAVSLRRGLERCGGNR